MPLVGGAWGHIPGEVDLEIRPQWVEHWECPLVGWSPGTHLLVGVEPGDTPLVGGAWDTPPR